MRLCITCEKSGGLRPAPSGTQSDRMLAGRQAEEILARLEILKAQIIRFSALFSQGTLLFQKFDTLLTLFSGKYCYKVVL